MRFMVLLGIFILLGGIAFAGCGCATAIDLGSGISAGGPDGNGTVNPGAGQNMAQQQAGNQTMAQNQTQADNMAQEQFQNQAGNGKPENSKGISEQVHQIMEQKKNGSIGVPPGLLVSIVARNQVMNIGNATGLMLNESLQLRVRVNGQNRTLGIEPDTDSISITDENVTVETTETIEIANESLMVAGKKVIVLPSAVPQIIKTKTINSAVLHVANGDPLYLVNATKRAKVLWIFGADMDVEIELDAVSGQVKNEKRPWWSFMAGIEEE